MARSNGRPEPEVIAEFADGQAYSKGKMEEALRVGILSRPAVTKLKETTSAKREDVDLLVHEMDIPRAQAERILIANDGDLIKALETLITPQI